VSVNNFEHKVAAITGAGSGMGRSLAVQLTNLGCEVAVSDVNEAELDQTVTLLNQTVKSSKHVVNVADREAIHAFAADVASDHGRVNLLFNNAGVSVTDTAEHMSYEDFEWLMDINFWGVVHGCKAFLPFLQQVDEAAIINTSSIFGTIALPTQSAYNASKFAVKAYTFSLRQELEDTHIGVSCVQPGGVRTNIVRSSRYVPPDNEASTKAEFVESFDSYPGISADEAARRILKGVSKNKARILVGGDANLVAILERIAPVGYMKLMAMFRP
jgi:NAD(P)-dependent dehydrogenase (short-subunit alcohol dehydrogenase family)